MSHNGKAASTRSIGALGQKRMEIKYDSQDGLLSITVDNLIQTTLYFSLYLR